MKYYVGKILVEVIIGDITKQEDLEAVVNAANKDLKPGGGVAGAIHNAAGPELYEACKPQAPIRVGEAIITLGYQLSNPYIIHTLGPVYGKDQPEDDCLAECYYNSLEVAKQHDVKSIGFPAISTGIFRFPKEEAAKVVAKVLNDYANKKDTIEHIRFVLHSEEDYKIYLSVIGDISN